MAVAPDDGRSGLTVALMAYDFRGDAVLGRAHEYWRAKRGPRAMPRRRDIDPRDLVPLLPYLQLTELIDGGARIRYRLVGTAIVATYGVELTGKHLDQVLSGARLDYVRGVYRTMCAAKAPVLASNRYVSRDGLELIAHRVIMPLSNDDVAINQALTAISFQYPNATTRVAGEWAKEKDNFDVNEARCEVIG
jgi:hypothetical protein